MADTRTVTVTFDDGSQHVYQNVPLNVTPADVEKKAYTQFGKKLKNIDGGATAAAPEEPTLGSQLWGAFKEGLSLPRHSLIKAPGEISGALSSAAYKAGEVVNDASAKVLPPAGAAALGTAANLGVESIPMFLGGGVAAKAEPFFDKAARFFMSSALKPDKAARESGKAADVVQTLLDKGVNVTEGGVAKLRGQIDDLNAQIAAKLEGHPGQILPFQAARPAETLAEKLKLQVNPTADVASSRTATNEFLNHPAISESGTLPVELAQALKVGTYRNLRAKGAYGELKNADVETQKALARGLKDEISKAVPGIEKLNAEEAKLLDAELLTQSRVLLDMNKNPGGLAWLVSHPAEAIGFMIDRSPLAKSLIARGIYAGKQAIPRTAGQVVGAGVGMASGRPPAEDPMDLVRKNYGLAQ